jgi:hypothetical protein
MEFGVVYSEDGVWSCVFARWSLGLYPLILGHYPVRLIDLLDGFLTRFSSIYNALLDLI